jgi:hypothetical protein
VAEVARKKRRTAGKATARAIVGVSLEVINKKRTEKPEVRSRMFEDAPACMTRGEGGCTTASSISGGGRLLAGCACAEWQGAM